jgi:hypothetical protein
MKLFKSLTPEEEKSYRIWARYNYAQYSPINGVWHPVIQDECRRMNQGEAMLQAIGVRSENGESYLLTVNHAGLDYEFDKLTRVDLEHLRNCIDGLLDDEGGAK